MLTLPLNFRVESVAAGWADPLAWPDADAMFRGAWRVDWRRRLKYAVRTLLTKEERAAILQECRANEFARALLHDHPRAFYPMMSHLLDRRLDARERCAATLESLRAIPARLHCDGESLLSQEGLALLEFEGGLRVALSISGVSFHEGLWQIGLHTAQQERLYSIGFGFTAPGKLLIANVQGASRGIDGLEQGRLATHAAQGMRPAHLLMHALRTLARGLGVASLTGIDPHHHVKGRWNVRRSRLQFDYRTFWAEHGGVRDGTGNWSLPLQRAPRPLEDVPAKRRAMYRRRYLILERLDHAILALCA